MATNTPLTFKNREFLLMGKPLRIFSGAIHYFRIVPDYWQDRLVKARACGLNTVETYVPWNLHEPKPGSFRNDGMLDLRRFIKMAADLEMYVIFRPGPYICSEWDFGGLPSWLLADPDMKVRSNYTGYQDAVERYYNWLLPQVTDLQYSDGGPIIAVQIENEYGSFSEDEAHLEFIRDIYLRHGISELLVTSDNESASKTAPILDGVLPTANGQTVEEIQACFEMIRRVNDQYPLMVMEFWSGWFDHWGRDHDVRSVDILVKTLEYAFQNQASVNFYMFHGGTNFGFMAGALNLSSFKADVTSYDYDAPLAEDGCLTEKFFKIKEMIEKESIELNISTPNLPELPNSTNRGPAVMKVEMEEKLSWSNLVKLIQKKSTSVNPRYMETYSYENGDVQSYGYIIYRNDINISEGSKLSLPGRVRDNAYVLINGKTNAQVNWEIENPSLDIGQCQLMSDGVQVLDIMVENLGRVNYTTKDNQDMLNSQRKGLDGPIKLDGNIIENWKVFALDFSEDFVRDIGASQSWKVMKATKGSGSTEGPALYRASFQLLGDPADYFVRLDGWHKGIVIVNGFNLGRYWEIGPQRTLYLPSPLLRHRDNEILVFEEKSAGKREITLDIEPCLK